MANTVAVFGPYAKTTWTNGVTPANATNMNHLEGQASTALNGFNPDVIGSGFVLSGMVCSKDGTTVNQLDVTSGRAYLVMTDGTLGLITATASTAGQFTTSTPSTTYYLFLLNNGTYQWSTTSSGPTNSMLLCTANTDGSGNITVVGDARVLNVTLFPGMSGKLSLLSSNFQVDSAGNVTLGGNLTGSITSTIKASIFQGSAVDLVIATSASGVLARNAYVQAYNGSTLISTLGVGDTNTAPFGVNTGGKVITAAGFATDSNSPGVSPIVKVATLAVSSSGQKTVLTYTPSADGLYIAYVWFNVNISVAVGLVVAARYTNPITSGSDVSIFRVSSGTGTFDTSGSTNFPTGHYSGAPVLIFAKAGSAITITYNEPSGTPTDVVKAVLMYAGAI